MDMDPKHDGVGANKEVKDASTPTRLPVWASCMGLTERFVEKNMEWKRESGQLSEHDKCRCSQRPTGSDIWWRIALQNPIGSALKPSLFLKLLIASVRCENHAGLHKVES